MTTSDLTPEVVASVCAKLRHTKPVSIDKSSTGQALVNPSGPEAAKLIEALLARLSHLEEQAVVDGAALQVVHDTIGPATPATAWETLKSVQGLIRARMDSRIRAREGK